MLVTGASAGIGRATAIKLAAAGAKVLLVARSAERLEEALEEVLTQLGRVVELDYAAVSGLSMVGGADWGLATDEQREQAVMKVEVRATYAGYIDRQLAEIRRQREQEALGLPVFDFTTMINYVYSGLVRRRFEGFC